MRVSPGDALTSVAVVRFAGFGLVLVLWAGLVAGIERKFLPTDRLRKN
jgi:hypothetical protein